MRGTVDAIDTWLDAEAVMAYREQPLAQDWARVAKVSEELGEAISELILWSGQNPRKAKDPQAYARMLDELADTSLTAMFAIQHFTKDERETSRIIGEKLSKIYDRVPEAYRE